MATLYITLQGKGGIGKSYVTSLFAQYLLNKETAVQVIDTDTVNPTLIKYKPLRAEHLQLSEEHVINPRALDELIKTVDAADEATSIVVDVGSSGFETLMAYNAENAVFELLEEMGHTVVINTIIAGRADAKETIKGAMGILQSTHVPIVLWLNEHLGPLLLNGEPIANATFLHEQEERILGTIILHKKTAATFGKDIEDMLRQRLTFEEALSSFDIMPRSRINRVKNEIWTQLDQLPLPGTTPLPQKATG